MQTRDEMSEKKWRDAYVKIVMLKLALELIIIGFDEHYLRCNIETQSTWYENKLQCCGRDNRSANWGKISYFLFCPLLFVLNVLVARKKIALTEWLSAYLHEIYHFGRWKAMS